MEGALFLFRNKFYFKRKCHDIEDFANIIARARAHLSRARNIDCNMRISYRPDFR